MNLTRNLLVHYYAAYIGQCRSVRRIVTALYKWWRCAVLETEPLKLAYKSASRAPLPNSPKYKGVHLKLPGRLITGPVRLLSCWQKNGSGVEGCSR